MQEKSPYQILLFYKYVHISNPQEVRDLIFDLCKKLDLKGRLIVATEGLNITLEGVTENTEAFIKELEKDERFLHIHYKRSSGTGKAFPRLSVKVRSELVSGHLGVCDVDPNETTGVHLSPKELHQWFTEGKEFYIVDMRNMYEHEVGHFAGSLLPSLENFRDLPKIVKEIAHLKDKTVLTVCTGGVRCEKASGYLITQGFTDIYQLDGGIVSYMEQYPNEHFEGKLYVFDQREVMGFYTDDPKHKVIGRCAVCKESAEHYADCDHQWCARHFIMCHGCEKKHTNADGALYCPQGCTLRKPERIKSPLKRALIKMKTLFKK
jgi:UPF0176 protein